MKNVSNKRKDDEFFSSLDEGSMDEKYDQPLEMEDDDSDLDLDEVDLESIGSAVNSEIGKKKKRTTK